MIECECKELLSEPDNIEYIRDQIGAILSVELANQFALAEEAADHNARDYNIAVYIENDDPLQYVDSGVNPCKPFFGKHGKGQRKHKHKQAQHERNFFA